MDQQRVTQSAAAGTNLLAVILLMCTAVTLFSCLDACAKYLVTHSRLPVEQVVWVRFAGQITGMLALVGFLNAGTLLRTSRLGWQTVRSLLMAATTTFNFLAVQELRLDQAVTITFLAPLVVALLAGPLLGEWVGWRRLTAIAFGFSGVLVAVRPGLDGFSPAFGYAFAAMLAYALFMLVTRRLAPYDTPMVTLFYGLLAGAVLGAPFAIAHWVWPAGLLEWVLLASLGFFGGLGHYLLIRAYGLAPASVVAPILYVQLLSMVALGYLVFGDMPDLWTLAGAAVIVASGVYLFHRERVTGRDVVGPAASSR